MANYILKEFNATRYEIKLSRETVGSVVNKDGKWTAILKTDGVLSKVTGFCTKSSAFYAVTMAHKVDKLRKRFPELEIPYISEGKATEQEEEYAREDTLYTYVNAWNTKYPQNPMRVATRRVRR